MEKVSNMTSITKLGGHHEREPGYTAQSNPDIKPDRTASNYRLDDDAGGSLVRRVNQRIADGYTAKNKDGTPKKIRDNAVRMVDVFCGTSWEFMDSLTADRQREYFLDCLDWVKNHYGEKNIVSAVVHMDETTPHLHVCAVPITDDGRLSAKDFMGGRNELRKIQDQYWEAVGRKWSLERGEPVEKTKREHLNVAQYKAETDSIRAKLEQARASIEAETGEAQKKLNDVKKQIKELEEKMSIKNEVLEGWIDKVKEEIKVEERKSGLFAKPETVAVLPVERINELFDTLESKIVKERETGRKVETLEGLINSKDKTIKNYAENWMPKEQLKVLGVTYGQLVDRAQKQEQARRQEAQKTKPKSTSYGLTD